MADKEDILQLVSTDDGETYADTRGNRLYLRARSKTAVVISGKSAKLCDLSASDANWALKKVKERDVSTIAEIWSNITGTREVVAPPHFIYGLCGLTEEATETISVKRPFWRTNPTVMSDPEGNKVELPSIYNNVGKKIAHTSALAEVKDMTGKQLCMVNETKARALDPKPSPYSHSFEATPGAIPNLCKKDGVAK